MHNLFYLIYTSIETKIFSIVELENLALKSQEKNSIRGITGILIYKDGNFIQYIEGQKKDIILLFEELLRDKRHKSIEVVERGNIKSRSFPEWSMLVKKINDSNNIILNEKNNIIKQYIEDHSDIPPIPIQSLIKHILCIETEY